MTKEALRTHLNNAPLIQAIQQKKIIDDTRKALIDAIHIIRATRISEAAQAEVQSKIDEYAKISRNYSILLEDTWRITWQAEAAIEKYIDYEDCDIERLPSTVSF